MSFPGDGYTAAMGWIQLLRYGGERDEVVEVDLPPQLSDANAPYYCWGMCPTFFDAPSTTREGVTWTADTFLTASPDALMTRTVQPVCGFWWGYTTQQRPPGVLPIELLDAKAWNPVRAELKAHYPGWDFLPG